MDQVLEVHTRYVEELKRYDQIALHWNQKH